MRTTAMASHGEGGRLTPPSEPMTPSLAAAPPAADAPYAGPVSLSLLAPGLGDGAAAGGGAPATRHAPPPAASSHGACGASSSSPDADLSAISDGAVARGGGVPGQGPAAAAAAPTPAGDASVLNAGPPVSVGDDGLPLSAEAAASPFSPPASERHAAFLKLVDHALKAGLHDRSMRCADFSALAAETGVSLFGGDSIIVANLWTHQALALFNQATVEADPAEKAALRRRAWVVLLAQALPVLQSRIDKGTLLPGTLRRVEEAFKVYVQQTCYRVTEQPVPGAAALLGLSRLMGYETALRAMASAMLLLPVHPWLSDERGRAQAFVLATLRLIPTAGLSNRTDELQLVDLIECHMTAKNYGADFCASVLAVWRSREVVDALRSRGKLQGVAVAVAASNAKFDARKQADLAKQGLWRCALPSCGKQEATVLQFRVCGHCQTTRYCCPEHGKLHWRAHKREMVS